MSEVPWHSASSILLRGAHGAPIGHLIVPASPAHFEPRDFAPFQTIYLQVHRRFSEYHPSEFSCLEEPTEAPEFLRLSILTPTQLMLRVRGTGTFPTWLVVQTWIIRTTFV